jgi:hypothetical protein
MMDDQIDYWIERFREGDLESAFHGLLDVGHEAIPDMISIFRTTPEREIRVFLAGVIRRYNDPSTLSFFREAIYDPDSYVWKEGMDGLVSLASQPALDALQSARDRQFVDQQDANDFRSWLDEAIEQVKGTIAS